MAVARLPASIRSLAASRGYLPNNVLLVKPVAATRGDRICARGEWIFINGTVSAIRRNHDLKGRPLPWWSGCRILRPGETFLMSARVRSAFDGRYFGVSRAADLVGAAFHLWPR